MTWPLIFDGHNDALLKLWSKGDGAVNRFQAGGESYVDLPRARTGNFAGGFFAIFVPNEDPLWWEEMQTPPYDIPMPGPLDRNAARRVVEAQIGILRDLDAADCLGICCSAGDIDRQIAAGRLAALMHLEGAEAIGTDLDYLERLYKLGLRSIGPVWSRPSIFGEGVPFRHPATGDIGAGLTAPGRDLVRRASELGMIVDTSHLNVRGFFDVAAMGIPLVATHSNACGISPHARNLTDAQLRAIGETGGMVGLNFATAFLRPDGCMVPDGALDWMVRHLDYMIDLAGENHVGLGSDFDGAMVPEEIGSVAGLDVLRERMTTAGYGHDLIARICHGNWLAAIRRIIG